jgi:hypothetical protein
MATKLVTVTESEIALDPSWDRARQLLSQGRFVAAALAEEIERLRAEFLRQGQGRRTDKQPLSQVVIKVGADGFQAQLRAQLGLHPQQAARLLENAARTRLIAQMTDAEDGETLYAAGDDIEGIEVTPERRALARSAMTDLSLGNITAGRAWAGVMGGGKTAGKNRAETDHHRNLKRALKALANSLDHWAELTPEERADIEGGWGQLVRYLPATWARE